MNLLKQSIFTCIVLSLPAIASAEIYTVSPTGSGDRSGSDWNNCLDWSTIEFNRGDTYYLMDGSYNSTTFSTEENGALIAIIKCGNGDGICETIDGYMSSNHDEQSIFTGGLYWRSSDWLLDGMERNNEDWSESSAYGFGVDNGLSGNGASLLEVGSFDDGPFDNITIRYVSAYYDDVLGGEDVSENLNHGLRGIGPTNLTMEHCHIQNISWKAAVFLRSTDGPIVVRYNYFENINKKELISALGTNNVVFAYNYCRNVAGTGALVADDSSHWDIYGNVFWSPDPSYTFTDVIMGTWTGDHPSRNETLNNWRIYNNTFHQMNGATAIQIQHGAGNEVRNNLFLGFASSINGSLIESNNMHDAPLGLVIDAAGGEFHLSEATEAGWTLPSPFDQDLDGNTRGSDGHFDIGAYEYDPSVEPLDGGPETDAEPDGDLVEDSGPRIDADSDDVEPQDAGTGDAEPDGHLVEDAGNDVDAERSLDGGSHVDEKGCSCRSSSGHHPIEIPILFVILLIVGVLRRIRSKTL